MELAGRDVPQDGGDADELFLAKTAHGRGGPDPVSYTHLEKGVPSPKPLSSPKRALLRTKKDAAWRLFSCDGHVRFSGK